MKNRHDLRLHRGHLTDAGMRDSYARLLRDVLGVAVADVEAANARSTFESWTPFCYLDTDGRCVANVDAAILPLMVDGTSGDIAAIRSVAVDPAWRGVGLFRALMEEALAWCDTRSAAALLYTAEPDLYRRFGFRPIEQHAFVGPAPAPSPCAPSERLDVSRARDQALIRGRVEKRAAISRICSLRVDTQQLMTNLAKEEAPTIALAAELDVLVAFETDDDTLVIADIVGSSIPTLARVVGAIGTGARRIKTLFPPDRLGWAGDPVREDTGLMIRGKVPAAMRRPFMFPPTAEF